MPKCFDTPKAFGHPSCPPYPPSCPAAATEGPTPFVCGDFTLSAHTLRSNSVVRPFSHWERLFLPKCPGTAVPRGDTCCEDAQCSPGTGAARLSPSCVLPLGDSVVLAKEVGIHCLGVGSFPEGVGERKETRRESRQQGRQGRSPAAVHRSRS